jgi:hypothetical protein
MTFGSISAVTSGQTAAWMSGTASSSGRLMRTTTPAPCWPTRRAAPATMPRAADFSAGAMASSRSRMIASAPRVCALATKRSTLTGQNSSERQAGRSVRIGLPPR